jgi:hypothetical protein
VATLSKGYDLDYIWKHVDCGATKDAASYYIQASESGGEPPGRWWGPGATALGVEPGQRIGRKPYDLLFGERQVPDRTQLGRPPSGGRKAADLYAQMLAVEPGRTMRWYRSPRKAWVRAVSLAAWPRALRSEVLPWPFSSARVWGRTGG